MTPKKPATKKGKTKPRTPGRRTGWANDRERWDQQPHESSARYQAFLVYRDQPASGYPRRSLAKVAQTCGKSASVVEQWSQQDEWRDRVQRYDRHAQAIQEAARQQTLHELGVNQGRTLAAAVAALSQPLQVFLERVQAQRLAAQAGEDPNRDRTLAELELSAIRAARALPRVLVTERLVHGLSTSNEDVHVTGQMTVQEARRQAESMDPGEQAKYLLGAGVDDGADQDRERVLAKVRARAGA